MYLSFYDSTPDITLNVSLNDPPKDATRSTNNTPSSVIHKRSFGVKIPQNQRLRIGATQCRMDMHQRIYYISGTIAEISGGADRGVNRAGEPSPYQRKLAMKPGRDMRC